MALGRGENAAGGGGAAIDYLPLEQYGLIGDMRTAALVGANGSIDWLCYPHFDSPSVFAALLDKERGGAWEITPQGMPRSRQQYLPETNVLLTRFIGPKGTVELTDFMPVPPDRRLGPGHTSASDGPPPRLVRQVCVLDGEVAFALSCRPAFDYARAEHTVEIADENAHFRSNGLDLTLDGTVPLTADGGAASRPCSRWGARTIRCPRSRR